MVSKCSNPTCSATFRYLHEGRLFYVAVGSAASEDEPAFERFWLCEVCSRKLTVVSSPDGVVVVPLQRRSTLEKRAISARPWDSA
jgi:hypothetical protein